jgi:hypothetical protein
LFLLYFDCFVCVKFYYTGLLYKKKKKPDIIELFMVRMTGLEPT